MSISDNPADRFGRDEQLTTNRLNRLPDVQNRTAQALSSLTNELSNPHGRGSVSLPVKVKGAYSGQKGKYDGLAFIPPYAYSATGDLDVNHFGQNMVPVLIWNVAEISGGSSLVRDSVMMMHAVGTAQPGRAVMVPSGSVGSGPIVQLVLNSDLSGYLVTPGHYFANFVTERTDPWDATVASFAQEDFVTPILDLAHLVVVYTMLDEGIDPAVDDGIKSLLFSPQTKTFEAVLAAHRTIVPYPSEGTSYPTYRLIGWANNILGQ